MSENTHNVGQEADADITSDPTSVNPEEAPEGVTLEEPPLISSDESVDEEVTHDDAEGSATPDESTQGDNAIYTGQI